MLSIVSAHEQPKYAADKCMRQFNKTLRCWKVRIVTNTKPIRFLCLFSHTAKLNYRIKACTKSNLGESPWRWYSSRKELNKQQPQLIGPTHSIRLVACNKCSCKLRNETLRPYLDPQFMLLFPSVFYDVK